MIQVTPHMRIFVCSQPVDFRKGIDGLAQVCRQLFKADPFSGYLFVFCNRAKTAIKILMYDGQGFWLCQKRLSRGRFKWWPKGPEDRLAVHELQLLILNGNPLSGQVALPWRKISP